jgi:hypothetical protein
MHKDIEAKDYLESKNDQDPFFNLAPLLKVRNYSHIRNNDDCIQNMKYIIRLLCKPNDSKPEYIKHSDFTTSPYLNKIFQDQGDKTPHEIFHIFHSDPRHAYGIEKIWDGEKTVYRLLQSWFVRISLGQWIGIDHWDQKSFDVPGISSIEKYAKNNLSLDEIKAFVFMIFNAIEFKEGLYGSIPHLTIQRCQVDEEKSKKLQSIAYIYPKIKQYKIPGRIPNIPFTLFDHGASSKNDGSIKKYNLVNIAAMESFLESVIGEDDGDLLETEKALLSKKESPLRIIVDDFISKGGVLPDKYKEIIQKPAEESSLVGEHLGIK